MNGFTIYKEYYELITLLTEREQQELLLAITKFMFEDVEPTLNDKQTKIFNNLRRPLEKSKKRSKCGSITKSNENQEENETKTKENQKENESKTHQDVNVIVNVNDNVDVNVNKITIAEIKGIIEYLNIKSNSHYKYSTDKTQTLIKARIKDGFTLDDFKIVIDKKCEEWLGTDFEKFLRPETLFSNKFEGYLNQKITAKKKTLKDISMSDIDRAIEIERKGSGLF
jgi:uncharacterized phage protein (TIGR02220 family)